MNTQEILDMLLKTGQIIEDNGQFAKQVDRPSDTDRYTLANAPEFTLVQCFNNRWRIAETSKTEELGMHWKTDQEYLKDLVEYIDSINHHAKKKATAVLVNALSDGCCPSCGSDNIRSNGRIDSDEWGEIGEHVDCDGCSKRFYVKYDIAEVSVCE